MLNAPCLSHCVDSVSWLTQTDLGLLRSSGCSWAACGPCPQGFREAVWVERETPGAGSGDIRFMVLWPIDSKVQASDFPGGPEVELPSGGWGFNSCWVTTKIPHASWQKKERKKEKSSGQATHLSASVYRVSILSSLLHLLGGASAMNKTPPAICLHGTLLSSGDEGRQIWGKVLLILNIFIIDIWTKRTRGGKRKPGTVLE